MILLDTNVFIYLANGTVPADTISTQIIAHASLTRIEALGYAKLTVRESLLLDELFSLQSVELALDNRVIERAISFSQTRQMRAADAIIAATAYEHDLTLWTANIDDFKHINRLHLYDPLAGQC